MSEPASPTPRRLALRQLLGLSLPLALGACASAPRPRPEGGADARPHWSGRLALRVSENASQSWSASFELQGDPEQGTLDLFSPLGSTVAHLDWAPGRALWQARGETRRYASLDALVADLSDTPVPVAALFAWLRGQPLESEGWHADLSQLDQGRLSASRQPPAPEMELRLVLDR